MQLDVSLTFQMVYAEKKTCVEENITIKSCDKNVNFKFCSNLTDAILLDAEKLEKNAYKKEI